MAPAPPILRLAGTSFGVERLRDLPRLILGATWLLGPGASRVVNAGTKGDARAAEARWARAAARILGMRMSIHGTHHIRPGQTYIVAPLHEGFADVVALLHLPLPLRFAARDELAGWQRLGPALATGDHVIVTPERPRSAYRTLRRAAPAVRDSGDSLVIFPQGSLLGIETAFTGGAFAIAAATGQPILPVVISGTHKVWEHPFSPTVRFGRRVALRVLPPVPASLSPTQQRELERRMKQVALTSEVTPRRYVALRDGFWDGYRFEIDADFPAVRDMVEAHRSTVASDAS